MLSLFIMLIAFLFGLLLGYILQPPGDAVEARTKEKQKELTSRRADALEE